MPRFQWIPLVLACAVATAMGEACCKTCTVGDQLETDCTMVGTAAECAAHVDQPCTLDGVNAGAFSFARWSPGLSECSPAACAESEAIVMALAADYEGTCALDVDGDAVFFGASDVCLENVTLVDCALKEENPLQVMWSSSLCAALETTWNTTNGTCCGFTGFDDAAAVASAANASACDGLLQNAVTDGTCPQCRVDDDCNGTRPRTTCESAVCDIDTLQCRCVREKTAALEETLTVTYILLGLAAGAVLVIFAILITKGPASPRQTRVISVSTEEPNQKNFVVTNAAFTNKRASSRLRTGQRRLRRADV